MNQRRKINDSSITKATREKRIVRILSVVNFFFKIDNKPILQNTPYLLRVARFLLFPASHLRIKSFCL